MFTYLERYKKYFYLNKCNFQKVCNICISKLIWYPFVWYNLYLFHILLTVAYCCIIILWLRVYVQKDVFCNYFIDNQWFVIIVNDWRMSGRLKNLLNSGKFSIKLCIYLSIYLIILICYERFSINWSIPLFPS